MLKSILKMRNVVAVAICLAGVTMFSGCDPNKGGVKNGFVIEAKNVAASSSAITTVKAEMYSFKTFTATYSSNGFKLTLPNEISDLPTGRHTITLWGIDKDDNYIGAFEYEGEKEGYYYGVTYSYATEDMVYQDESEYDYEGYLLKATYNCNLKKGWNTEYNKTVVNEVNKTITSTATTDKPSGVNFSWQFYSLY